LAENSAKETHFGERLKISRIEALSDGVFSIAMTLMVLSLKFPDEFPSNPTHEEMVQGFIQSIPALEKYLISFLVLGIYWMRHQAQFTFIQFATRGLLYINIIFLMFVALIPATTDFLMNYSNNQIPLLLYLLNNFLICLILVWHWYYITKMNPSLIVTGLPPEMIRLGFHMLVAACLLFLIAMLISFWSLRISFMVLYVIPLAFPVFRHIEKRYKKKKYKTIYG
jgi:uncharacterized membrane protein